MECAICLDSMVENKILPCCHKFHANCINIWLRENNNCPLCRQHIKPPTLKKLKNKLEYTNEDYDEFSHNFPNGVSNEYAEFSHNFPTNPPLNFLDPHDDSSGSDSDDEKSIDYGDESEFEEECMTWEEDTRWSFRVSSTLVVDIM